jgi:hypothetical protein
LPGGLLYSNIIDSGVFRTESLDLLPPTLLRNDDQIASDHLPVLITFRSPRSDPFRILSATTADGFVRLRWQAQPGRRYRVDVSPDLGEWKSLEGQIETRSAVGIWNSPMRFSQRFYRIWLLP